MNSLTNLEQIEPLVAINSVSVRYKETLALKDVSLNIKNLDYLAVIGPNGGGKTTLIKVILGRIIPFSGQINYNKTLQQGSKLAIGYLPQYNTIDKEFPIKASEIILSGLSQRGFPLFFTKKDRQRVDELLEFSSISELKNRRIAEMSGGQVQKIFLCRAIISNPRLLILDEPDSFLDSNSEKELYRLLGEINKTSAIIIVTHDIASISKEVKSVVCIDKTLHYHQSNHITENPCSFISTRIIT